MHVWRWARFMQLYSSLAYMYVAWYVCVCVADSVEVCIVWCCGEQLPPSLPWCSFKVFSCGLDQTSSWPPCHVRWYASEHADTAVYSSMLYPSVVDDCSVSCVRARKMTAVRSHTMSACHRFCSECLVVHSWEVVFRMFSRFCPCKGVKCFLVWACLNVHASENFREKKILDLCILH